MSLRENQSADAAVEEAQSDKKTLEKMTKEEMREELENFRALWQFLPNELQYFLSQIGKEVVFVDRMNATHFGNYHGFECNIIKHKLYSTTLRYDQVTHKPYIEEGTAEIFASTLTNFKFLNSRVEKIEES